MENLIPDPINVQIKIDNHSLLMLMLALITIVVVAGVVFKAVKL